MKIDLTQRQCDAVVDVLNERIAGGTDDLRDALGLTNKAAAEMMRILDRVLNKLSAREESNA